MDCAFALYDIDLHLPHFIMTSKKRKANEMSIYHPHDLLIAKFFPDKDLLSIGYDSHEYSGLRRDAMHSYLSNDEPPRIPWPLPPLRPRESQEAGVKQWRRKALRTINSRIAMFTPGSVPKSTSEPPNSRASTQPDFPAPVHRMLLIPELLELILQQATPETQHNSWNVNRLWRSTLERILAYEYRSYHPCPPVGYADHIRLDSDISWMQPSTDEIAVVERELENAAQKGLHELAEVYYPARIAQAIDLPEDAYVAIRTSYERLRFKPAESNPTDRSRRWSDLSQIRMNPHIVELFGIRMEIKRGRWEIALKAGGDQPCLLQGSLPGGNFADRIADMFLTDPPCKALGVYVDQSPSAFLKQLARVCDEDGIRVRPFLDALEHHANELLSTWISQANDMRQEIKESHWTDYSTAQQKRRLWKHYGSPKFVVFLEQTDVGPPTLAQNASTYGEDFLTVRANEWSCDAVHN
jgi:hypothetical protein